MPQLLSPLEWLSQGCRLLQPCLSLDGPPHGPCVLHSLAALTGAVRRADWSVSPLAMGSSAQPVPCGAGLEWPCQATSATLLTYTLTLRCVFGCVWSYWALMAEILDTGIGLLERVLAWYSFHRLLSSCRVIGPTLHMVSSVSISVYLGTSTVAESCLPCGILCTNKRTMGQHP